MMIRSMGVRLEVLPIGLLSWVLSCYGFGQVVCPYNFTPGGGGDSANRYEMSIFAIGARQGDEGYDHRGTAYLIRTRGDYALTAAHVVETLDEIVGKSDARPDERFEFESVAKTDTGDSKKDVALLRLASGGIPQEALRLEFSATEPTLGQSLFGLGHPKFKGDFGLAVTNPIFRRRGQGGMLVFETRTIRGTSGGPIFDEAGRVVATVVEKSSDRQEAFGHPNGSQAIVDLLIESDLQLSLAAEEIDAELRKPGIKQDVIASRLRYLPHNVSNIDLVLLAKRIEEDTDAYNHEVLECPLLQAMVQRGVPTPRTYKFAALLEKVKSDALRDGMVLLANGEPDGAKAKFELSFDASVWAARHIVSDYIDWPISVSCYVVSEPELPGKLMALQPAEHFRLEELDPDVCEPGLLANQRLSALFTDAATAKWNSIKIIGEDTTSTDWKELLTAVGFGALLAERRGTRANSYAVLGETLAARGDRVDARSAFSAAYEDGLRAHWLESQWNAVSEEGSIASYPKMELEHVHEVLQELAVFF